ncbi:MAG: hypothetical protein ACLP05_08760 [Candidatus Kryptoniota bacterium]
MNSESDIREILQGLVWDYKIDPYDLYLIALGKKESIGFLNKERTLIRLLEGLSWYKLLSLFGADFLRENLTADLIQKIWYKGLRERYETIRRILQGEAVSTSGWSAENRKRLAASVLSDRRYGAQ